MPPGSPGRIVRGRVSWCCSLAPERSPRNLGRPAAPIPAPGRRARPSPACLIAGHDGPDTFIGAVPPRCRRRPGRLTALPRRHDERREHAKPWESSAPFNNLGATTLIPTGRAGTPATFLRSRAPNGSQGLPGIQLCGIRRLGAVRLDQQAAYILGRRNSWNCGIIIKVLVTRTLGRF